MYFSLNLFILNLLIYKIVVHLQHQLNFIQIEYSSNHFVILNL